MKKALVSALTAVVALALASGDSAISRERRQRDHDHDFARGALQRGEVLPITRLLSIAAQYLPGDVVEVKLEPRRNGDLHYKIKVLTASGRIRELVLDARTGDYVAIED